MYWCATAVVFAVLRAFVGFGFELLFSLSFDSFGGGSLCFRLLFLRVWAFLLASLRIGGSLFGDLLSDVVSAWHAAQHCLGFAWSALRDCCRGQGFPSWLCLFGSLNYALFFGGGLVQRFK